MCQWPKAAHPGPWPASHLGPSPAQPPQPSLPTQANKLERNCTLGLPHGVPAHLLLRVVHAHLDDLAQGWGWGGGGGQGHLISSAGGSSAPQHLSQGHPNKAHLSRSSLGTGVSARVRRPRSCPPSNDAHLVSVGELGAPAARGHPVHSLVPQAAHGEGLVAVALRRLHAQSGRVRQRQSVRGGSIGAPSCW